MASLCKQPFLLLADTIKAAIVVDHHGDRQPFLKGRLDRQTPGQKRPVARDNDDVAVRVQRLGGNAEGDTDPKQ